MELIEAFPIFKPIYEQIYEICRNMEGYMPLFAEQLRNLDRNTMRLMYDELKEENDELKEQNDGLKTALKQKDAVIKQTASKMTELLEMIVEMMLENKDSIQSIIQKTGMSEAEIRQIAADNGIPLEQ